jgi:5'(3')-deoxyribonucleotidase
VLEVKPPSPTAREFYFKKKLKEDDLKGIDLERWVKDTEGMSFAHLKEVILAAVVMGNNYEGVIKRLRAMSEIN